MLGSSKALTSLLVLEQACCLKKKSEEISSDLEALQSSLMSEHKNAVNLVELVGATLKCPMNLPHQCEIRVCFSQDRTG